MMKKLNLIFSLLFMLVVAGCSSKGDVVDAGTVAVEDQSASSESADNFKDSGMTELGDMPEALSHRVIYFAYDSYDVSTQDRDLIAAHAAYLSSNPGSSVKLEGHGDERGSREYNIALGDRRNGSVKRMLELQGVSPGQISMVSYGEEKAAVEGHDESAWSLNRRVELIYAGM
ncbi:MAG: peptidoglycan-associated lipoprotein Pal [Gammaproteobacteria bacterium]